MSPSVQRFNLMATTSYASLDMHWKGHLKHLHNDYLETRQVFSSPSLFSSTDVKHCSHACKHSREKG